MSASSRWRAELRALVVLVGIFVVSWALVIFCGWLMLRAINFIISLYS